MKIFIFSLYLPIFLFQSLFTFLKIIIHFTINSMLSYNQFQQLWSNPAPNGFGLPLASLPADAYPEYCIREIYRQDYLDLFSGVATFTRVNIGGAYYVSITGSTTLSGLGIPFDSLYSLNLGGIHYLRVDYDYPWSAADLAKQRVLRYIMIGEAPPQRKPVGSPYPFGLSSSNTYFYHILHTGTTAWLTSPIAAFTPSPTGIPSLPVRATKHEKLLYLADNGYYLHDLFPFAIPYAGLRSPLILGGTAQHIFQYSVLPELNRLIGGIIPIEASNNKASCILAFSGPPKIHHHLAHLISLGTIILPPGLFCRVFMNDTNPALGPMPLNWFRTWVSGNLINGVQMCRFTKIPFYTCCTYNALVPTAGPHALFIKGAFL